MTYRFAVENQDYSDFSGGRVLYSQPGQPAFPVRLSSEIFQRAVEILTPAAPLHIYDPACGGAYHLTALGFMFGPQIQSLTASDIDEDALALARRNLGLLSAQGLSQREAEIRRMLIEYGKPSHTEALRSLETLREMRRDRPEIQTRVFQANALDPSALARELSETPVDLVISDIPYGQLSAWHLTDQKTINEFDPLDQMLEALLGVLSSGALVAIAADKAQKIHHPGYRRIERFKVGKRQVTFLSPAA